MLKIFNLEQASVDRCLYFNKDQSLLLAIYVDDGLAAGSNSKELDRLIDHLRNNFELKVMACESYLGFEIIQDRKAKTLSIVQDHYVDKMLDKFDMADVNAVPTPELVGSRTRQNSRRTINLKSLWEAYSILPLARGQTSRMPPVLQVRPQSRLKHTGPH